MIINDHIKKLSIIILISIISIPCTLTFSFASQEQLFKNDQIEVIFPDDWLIASEDYIPDNLAATIHEPDYEISNKFESNTMIYLAGKIIGTSTIQEMFYASSVSDEVEESLSEEELLDFHEKNKSNVIESLELREYDYDYEPTIGKPEIFKGEYQTFIKAPLVYRHYNDYDKIKDERLIYYAPKGNIIVVAMLRSADKSLNDKQTKEGEAILKSFNDSGFYKFNENTYEPPSFYDNLLIFIIVFSGPAILMSIYLINQYVKTRKGTNKDNEPQNNSEIIHKVNTEVEEDSGTDTSQQNMLNDDMSEASDDLNDNDKFTMNQMSTQWKAKESLWLIFCFIIFLNFAAFLFIGRRANNLRWTIYGYAYLIPGTIIPILTFQNIRAGTTLGVLCLLAWFLSWAISIIHAFFCLEKYLKIRYMKTYVPPKPKHSQIYTKNEDGEKRVECGKIDINSCTENELTSLPGIGIVDAKKTITIRQREGGFSSIDDFIDKLDIKPHFAEQIKTLAHIDTSMISNLDKKKGRILDI